MKKVILFLLLLSFKTNAQEHIEKLKGDIEIDGHIVKEDVFFKANLDGIEIYDEKRNKYKKRKCVKNDCKIIHLELKNYFVISESLKYNYPNLKINN